jgi:hypothetical protein
MARELNVSRQAIHDLIGRGIISPDADGLLDAELVRVALANRVRPSGKTAAALGHSVGSLPPAGNAADTGAAPDSTSYHVAKTLREAAEARIAQLKLAEMERKLIDAAGAKRAAYTAFRSLRDALMVVGRKIAPTVAAQTDPRDVQQAIESAIRDALDAFARRTLVSLSSDIGDGCATEDSAVEDPAS